jgi:hypothetical protein
MATESKYLPLAQNILLEYVYDEDNLKQEDYHIVKNLNIESSNFDTESEMLIDASRKGVSIYSVAIKTIYGDETSQIHPVKDTIRFFSLIVKHMFKKR